MEEKFDILDEQGNKTGQTKERSRVHSDGDWHKAVFIFILNEKDEVLLQFRGPEKDTFPNMWDISTAGHVKAGSDSLKTAVQEIKEEIGLDIEAECLQFIDTFVQHGKDYGLKENQLDDLFVLKKRINFEDVKIDDNEVRGIKFFPRDDLELRVSKKDQSIVPHWNLYEALFEYIDHLNR
jgi:isopentenyl-diphosphate Delta-isomerase